MRPVVHMEMSLVPLCDVLFCMQFVDTSVGSLVMALKYNGVYEKTAIIITAKHGQVGPT